LRGDWWLGRPTFVRFLTQYILVRPAYPYTMLSFITMAKKLLFPLTNRPKFNGSHFLSLIIHVICRWYVKFLRYLPLFIDEHNPGFWSGFMIIQKINNVYEHKIAWIWAWHKLMLFRLIYNIIRTRTKKCIW